MSDDPTLATTVAAHTLMKALARTLAHRDAPLGGELRREAERLLRDLRIRYGKEEPDPS